MARRTRSPKLYTGDVHSTFAETSFVMLIPDDEAADANRGWSAPVGGESGLPARMTPRHVVGKDGAGHSARCIVAGTGAALWDGTATTFTVDGVVYTVTGYVGEQRTQLSP